MKTLETAKRAAAVKEAHALKRSSLVRMWCKARRVFIWLRVYDDGRTKEEKKPGSH